MIGFLVVCFGFFETFLQLAELAFSLRQFGLGRLALLCGLAQCRLPFIDFGLLGLEICVEPGAVQSDFGSCWPVHVVNSATRFVQVGFCLFVLLFDAWGSRQPDQQAAVRWNACVRAKWQLHGGRFPVRRGHCRVRLGCR